jgi:hypothetical protein
MYKKQIKTADQISGLNASQYPFSPESFVSLFEKQRLEYTEI